MAQAVSLRFGLIGALVFTTAVSRGENWHQWRGPNGDGSSSTAVPPIRWEDTKGKLGHNIKWKTEIPGKGSSTPIVWQDRVFVLTAIPTDREDLDAADEAPPANAARFGTSVQPTHFYQFVLLCYDRSGGAELWRSVAVEAVPHEPGHTTNTYASSSPITDGRHLYVSFGSHGVFCFDMDGKRIWRQDLGQMRTRRGFGEASSPALHDGLLVVPWDHEDQSFIAALDAATGKVKWRTDRDELTTWATPLIVEHPSGTQVITNGHTVCSYDLQSGELVWQCGGQAYNPVPAPVARDGVVYCMTGYRGNSVFAISLDAKGDAGQSGHVRWSRSDAAPYVASPVLYRDRLYFTKSLGNILTSLDAHTGQPLIAPVRLGAVHTFYASPVAADGRIYFTSREGTTVVIQDAPKLEVLATNQLGETVDASPALVDKEIFIRGEKHLFCIAEPRER